MLRLRLLGIFTLLVTITFSPNINAQGRRKSPVRGNRQTENADAKKSPSALPSKDTAPHSGNHDQMGHGTSGPMGPGMRGSMGPGMGMHGGMSRGMGPGMGMGRGIGMGRGMGMGMGRGMGPGFGGQQLPIDEASESASGHNHAGTMQSDMSVIHGMFNDRSKIRRWVNFLPDGAVAYTESDDPQLVKFLQSHVPSMDSRVVTNSPLPPMTFQPVFTELIKHAKDYALEYEDTENGVKVTYQSDNPYVVMLVREHAKLVGRFIHHGHQEIHAPYTLPKFSAAHSGFLNEALQLRIDVMKEISNQWKVESEPTAQRPNNQSCLTAIMKWASDTVPGSNFEAGFVNTANPQKTLTPSWVSEHLDGELRETDFSTFERRNFKAALPLRAEANCVSCHQQNQVESAETLRMKKAGDTLGWIWLETR